MEPAVLWQRAVARESRSSWVWVLAVPVFLASEPWEMEASSERAGLALAQRTTAARDNIPTPSSNGTGLWLGTAIPSHANPTAERGSLLVPGMARTESELPF